MRIIKKIIPILILIVVLIFGLVCSNTSDQAVVEVEEIKVEEEQKEKVAKEPEEKFSFYEYVDESKVREYKMVDEEDISIKALGDKLLSEYTLEELDKLPTNYRMKYSITIPRDITEEELKSTLAQIIKEKSTKNPDIDEVVVFSWYFEGSVGQTAAMGRAEWCPNGEWGGLSPEIAKSNDRDTYKIVFDQIDIQIYEDEVKFSLTESERMQAFYDLVKLQDSIPFDDPQWEEKNDESYITIAKKYGITEEQMHEISTEGIIKGWPMPSIEEEATEELEEASLEQPLIISFSDSIGNIIRNSTNNSTGENESEDDFTISPNDTLEFSVTSTGANDFYKFGYCVCNSEDSPFILMQDWSYENSCTWTVTADVPESTMVLVIVVVKNNDGIEELGGAQMGYCDDSSAIGYFTEINF